ncbi:MAG: methylcobalamin:coenzyme M methyltransferase [Chloroflexi bacterium ADurb.Bin325]|nr:MAG: methylcobalamin:coenzyme M methyltransferase [Chloroflexi bacterium ADurb.Bin325]
MNSRDRVMAALEHRQPDRVPKDLAGMRSTGIAAFAYPKLVQALGLPPRVTRVEDTGQMLALPEPDVLDALGIDVVTICDGVTSAFVEPHKWRRFNFNGRLDAAVRYPSRFHIEEDGTIRRGNTIMPPSSYVFDELHGGQPLNLNEELPKPDLKKLRAQLARRPLTDKRIKEIREHARRVRESSDRAVFFNNGAAQMPIGIGNFAGLAIFPILCITEPDLIAEYHELLTAHREGWFRALLPEIAPYVDVIMMAADDWGTQNTLIASPKVYRNLFLPYYRRANNLVHELAPGVKTFLHCCGAVYDLIDLFIESGFDILNPVQWSAGKRSYREWKDRARGRIALWGGGVNAQVTLALGTADDVARQAHEVVSYLNQDGGYVFCNIHNILAEITPEKVVALYRAADEVSDRMSNE